MPFTDCDKDTLTTDVTNKHRAWSLSLNETPGKTKRFVGELHENKYRLQTDIEMQIDFYAQVIPDVKKIFMFNNKRYVCRKFEYYLQNGKKSPIIRGYFYEMQ